MKYNEFFKTFYIGENDGFLKNHTTTWAIPKFFAEVVLQTEEYKTKLPQDDMSFDKWFQGNASPRNHWSNMQKDYNEKILVDALLSEIDDSNLPDFVMKLGISTEGDDVNRELLCIGIAQQFKMIIDGKGEAKDIIQDIYTSGNTHADFLEYINKASQRYNVMKLIGGDEVPLEKFFVCNTIGEKERVFADKNRIRCAYLDDPDMKSIREIFSNRGYDNLRTVLIGSGGCGKSLMLQHLFLQAAQDYTKSGILPIFLELRHFKQSDEVLEYIVKSVYSLDGSFNEEVANGLLLSGKCQLLLDGFDEIDPSDVKSFLRKLKDFTSKYDKTQIVVSSRQNESLTGFSLFAKLFVWPFEEKQSLLLIDKILDYQGETGARDAVLEYINNGFLKKNGVFVSHPLLLTYVTMKYPSYSRFNENPSFFYKVTFDALVSGHDDNKKPYDRVFMSVDNAEQFSQVFKEFCALTYKDGILQLDTQTFEEYFNHLKTYKVFENPHKMNVKNFKHDVCSTACIMYEKEYDIFYIDPGFQECLFAEYYARASEDEVIELLQSLEKISFTKLSRFEALDMLCQLSREKFRYKLLLPFLDAIFKAKDDREAFINFLQACFDDVTIVNINQSVQILFMEALKLYNVLYPQEENYSKTILLNYILRDMGVTPDFDFSLYAKDGVVEDGTIKSLEIPNDAEVSGVIIGQETSVGEERCLLIDSKPMDAYEYFWKEHKNGKQDGYLVDNDKELIKFGTRITIDGYYLMNEPGEFVDMIQNVAKNSEKTYSMFLRLKEYYKKLKVEKHRSGLN